uniref:Uncharacterized protein n=1 Tax=Setaria viridis TaxID=4556 RepID=A0A4U6U1P1_SETVI|nr:hypothetical protein SEVIR_7G078566v2 [Setaria viridis]
MSKSNQGDRYRTTEHVGQDQRRQKGVGNYAVTGFLVFLSVRRQPRAWWQFAPALQIHPLLQLLGFLHATPARSTNWHCTAGH